MKKDDALAYQSLAFAFTGKKAMPEDQHRKVKATARQAKYEFKESPGKRRSRWWGLGPKWARLV